MTNRILAYLLLALGPASLVLTGCVEPPLGRAGTSAGSLALSTDDAFLYVADTDNDAIEVVDTAAQQKVLEIKVGRAPERVVVADDDTVYVSNRGSRSVSVFRRDEWSTVTEVRVGIEPMGLAVDQDTLYVVSSTATATADSGTLTAIDRKTLATRWELPVGEEPRGVALLPGRRALVTLFRHGDAVVVDLDGPSVLRAGSDLYVKANSGFLGGPTRSQPLPGSGFPSFHPRSMADAVPSPDGRRVYAPVLWTTESKLVTGNDPAAKPTYGNGGPCGGGVVTAGVATFDAETADPLVDSITSCFPNPSSRQDYPASVLSMGGFVRDGSGMVIQGPAVTAVDPTGTWLFVVNRESRNVAIVPTLRRPVTDTGADTPPDMGFVTPERLVSVGAGANGIALTRDGRTAYVYNAFDHSVSVLRQGPSRTVIEAARFEVANEVLPPAVAAGRRLFFDATDSRMSTTGIACSTCHPDGREDGHIWLTEGGPRQTPSVAGRMMTQTAPFHLSGKFPTLGSVLNSTVALRMGGTGLQPSEAELMAAFVDALAAPDNPHRLDSPTEAQQRGAQVFQSAGCAECHNGPALTNNGFADVGTFVTSGPLADDPAALPEGINTPSLLGLARTAPYLHDGSAASLRDGLLKDQASNRHGLTAGLSSANLEDLVEYLKSL